MPVKQVIVVRTKYPDGRGGFFKPRTGKLITQGAHASMKVFFDRQVKGLWSTVNERLAQPTEAVLVVPLDDKMEAWINGSFAKVCVRATSEAELLDLHQKAQAAGLPCALIQDSGKTEFHGQLTYTALAIGPAKAADIDPITGHLTLL